MGEEETFDEDLFDAMLITVDPGQSPLRIDKFLMDKIVRLSRSKIQDGIVGGAVKVNSQLVKPNYKVRPLDKIELLVPKSNHEQGSLQAEDIPLDVVFEDADLLVVNKPAGLVVHPGVGNHSGTLVNALMFHLSQVDLPVLEGNSFDRPGLVHRIDKNTSGLLVIAKNEFTLSHLARQFFDHSTERTYWALVWGQPDHEEGTIENFIGRDVKERTRQKVYEDEELGKRAVTHYKMLDPMYYVSLLECKLETGRTHQIRVHLSHINHPLFGDDKYGGDRIVKGTVFQKYKQFVANCLAILPHQALHAKSLSFTHPKTLERMEFSVEPPVAFLRVLEKWRGYVQNRKAEQDHD